MLYIELLRTRDHVNILPVTNHGVHLIVARGDVGSGGGIDIPIDRGILILTERIRARHESGRPKPGDRQGSRPGVSARGHVAFGKPGTAIVQTNGRVVVVIHHREIDVRGL